MMDKKRENISMSIYILKRKIRAGLSRIPYYICGLLPIKKNKIVFSAFEGGGYCCNPKYIAEELINREKINNDYSKYDMYWLVNDMTKEFPIQIKKKKNNLWNRAYHLSTANIWIDNARKNYGTRKRKQQHYILTWHGPVGFKPVGRLRGESFSEIAEIVSIADAKNVDVLLSNSDWCSNIWKNAFWNEPIIKTGSPRCDILFNKRNEKRNKIRERYNLTFDTKIIMYAPTFRGGSQSTERKVFADIGTIDFDKLKCALEEKFGGTWIIFVRLHPQLAIRGISCNDVKNDVIDVTNVDDMYELLAATDAFISDYSSAAFDASYMRIPVFLYVEDLEDYMADRGKLTWDIDEIPFSMAKNNVELGNIIRKFDEKKYLNDLKRIFEKIALLEDGKASDRVANIVDKWI